MNISSSSGSRSNGQPGVPNPVDEGGDPNTQAPSSSSEIDVRIPNRSMFQTSSAPSSSPGPSTETTHPQSPSTLSAVDDQILNQSAAQTPGDFGD